MLTIVFDTNYLRSLGMDPFLEGRLPDLLQRQVTSAVKQGHLLLLPETVRLEFNAWLLRVSQQREENHASAVDSLRAAGYTVTPPDGAPQGPADILQILQTASPGTAHLRPSLEDYQDAERRTSYRLAPLPKNPEGEEFRDRLVWCQLIRYATTTTNSILVVSADQFFKNGSETDEGRACRIEVVANAADLDQRIGQRPPHIEALLKGVLVFETRLRPRGIALSALTINAIEELTNVTLADGTFVQRFQLLTSGAALPERTGATLSSAADGTRTLTLHTNPEIVASLHPGPGRRPPFLPQSYELAELRRIIEVDDEH